MSKHFFVFIFLTPLFTHNIRYNLSLHFSWLFFHLRLHKFDKQFLPITFAPFFRKYISSLTAHLSHTDTFATVNTYVQTFFRVVSLNSTLQSSFKSFNLFLFLFIHFFITLKHYLALFKHNFNICHFFKNIINRFQIIFK